MAPLADAVRLIYGNQTHFNLLQKKFQLAQQSLGRHVDEFYFPLLTAAAQALVLCRRLHAVERTGRNTCCLQRLHLVLHQRYQGRHNNSCAGHSKSRNLIADTLSAAGGHQHKRIVTAHHAVDNLFLLRAETIVAKIPF